MIHVRGETTKGVVVTTPTTDEAPFMVLTGVTRALGLVVVSLLCSASAGAQDAPAVLSRDASGGYVVRATRIAEPIRVDGRFDDAPYLSVPPITELQQQEPRAGAPITEHTEMGTVR